VQIVRMVDALKVRNQAGAEGTHPYCDVGAFTSVGDAFKVA
jgi:hypothetical protein